MKALNQRLAAGHHDAFAEWYDAIANAVYHYLLVQTNSSHDAADIMQNTFVRLYKHRSGLKTVTNLQAYTFRMARNEWLRWKDTQPSNDTTLEPWFEPIAANDSAGEDRIADVQSALTMLDDRYREVIELKVFARLTFAEIADVMQAPAGTVATWYRRAVLELKKRLSHP